MVEGTDGLPDGWAGYFDHGSSRWYYHHRPTSTTQWERPVPPTTTTTADLAAETAVWRVVPADVKAIPPVTTPATSATSGAPIEPVVQAAPAITESAPIENPWLPMLETHTSPWKAWQGPQRERGAAPHRPPSPVGGFGRCPRQWKPHIPCLLKQTVDQVFPANRKRPDGTFDGAYVDCTFGRGGHTEGILGRLSPDARLFAFDVDPEAVAVAKRLEAKDKRFKIIHRPFGDIGSVFQPGQLDGVVFDLGVSSPQLDEKHRGFSCVEECPLDLRMNQQQGISASEWLRGVTTEELAWVIHNYGEDDDPIHSERIAEMILLRQREFGGKIASTKRLSEAVERAKASSADNGMHPAKLTFQAIRVHLNQEMHQLDNALRGAFRALVPGGRCCVISFKRKEASAIRRFVREHEEPDTYFLRNLSTHRSCELFPLLATGKNFTVRQVGQPIKASPQEISSNYRARSAAVHILQKERRERPCLNLVAPPREFADRFREPTNRPLFVGDPSSDAGLTQATLTAWTQQQLPPSAANEASDAQVGDPAPSTIPLSLANISNMPDQGPANLCSPDVSHQPNDLEESVGADRPHGAVTFEQIGLEELFRPPCVQRMRVHVAFGEVNSEGARADGTGYLALLRGDVVHVEYKGQEEDELGWSFGFVVEGERGWFPTGCLVAIPDKAG